MKSLRNQSDCTRCCSTATTPRPAPPASSPPSPPPPSTSHSTQRLRLSTQTANLRCSSCLDAPPTHLPRCHLPATATAFAAKQCPLAEPNTSPRCAKKAGGRQQGLRPRKKKEGLSLKRSTARSERVPHRCTPSSIAGLPRDKKARRRLRRSLGVLRSACDVESRIGHPGSEMCAGSMWCGRRSTPCLAHALSTRTIRSTCTASVERRLDVGRVNTTEFLANLVRRQQLGEEHGHVPKPRAKVDHDDPRTSLQLHRLRLEPRTLQHRRRLSEFLCQPAATPHPVPQRLAAPEARPPASGDRAALV
mmetsp:Transcript_34589/g.110477  ORF Transcript_34589/g.110477 Transcript_34589/m.110477 type:complete len:305 (-) Transcript_34589:177-1091(-)